jgi:putative PIN family toxin of toxin-antitoxin system
VRQRGHAAELEHVLGRPRLDRFQTAALRMEFAAVFRRHAHLFAVSAAQEAAVEPACRDAKDNKFLALAKACDAQVLVSSDADLRVLHPWNGAMPLQFADRLNNVETSAIRELFKLLGKPGIISFAGGFPDPPCLMWRAFARLPAPA